MLTEPALPAQAAVKILWESCIKPLDFPRSVEACVAVLRRVRDIEASIQDLVTKTFHSLWFAPSQATGEILPLVAAGPDVAGPALTCYSRASFHMQVPVQQSWPCAALTACRLNALFSSRCCVPC